MKRRRSLVSWSIIALIAGAAVAVEATSRIGFERTKSHARDVGLAVSLADVRGTRPPDAENAAISYRRALDELGKLSKDDRTLGSVFDFFSSRRLPPAMQLNGVNGLVGWERAQKALTAWAPIFADVEEGNRRPKFDFEHPWDRLPMPLKEYPGLRQISRAMSLDAEIASRSGDLDRAVSRLETIRTLGHQCTKEKLLVSMFAGLACYATADRKAMELAYKNRDNAAFVAKIRRYFQTEPPLPDLRSSLRGESYLAVAGLDQMSDNPNVFLGPGPPDGDWTDMSRLKYRLLRLGLVRRSAEGRILDRLTRAFESLPTDPNDWRQVREVSRGLAAQFGGDRSLAGEMAGLMAPSFASVGNSFCNTVIRRHQGILFTQIMDEQRATGRWPAKLPNLPGVTDDPYSKKTLAYRVSGDEFRLYSIGQDQVDNGGAIDRIVEDIVVGVVKGRFIWDG
jgi:hypothetical protein